MHLIKCITLLCFSVLSVSSISGQELDCIGIDFETGGQPGEPFKEVALQDEFRIGFRLEKGSFPFLAKANKEPLAFAGMFGTNVVEPSFNGGEYFISELNAINKYESNPLVLTFTHPVVKVSGYIIDIDDGEVFICQALNFQNQVVAEQTLKSSDSNAGDGRATFWEVQKEGVDIYGVRIKGKKNEKGIGFGVDNLEVCFKKELNAFKQATRIKQNKPLIVPPSFKETQLILADESIVVESPDLTLKLWDDNKEDGDIVSLFLNDDSNCLVPQYQVKKKGQKFPITLKQTENLLIFFAENEGRNPPNTAGLEIDDGVTKQRIVLKADKKTSKAIRIQVK